MMKRSFGYTLVEMMVGMTVSLVVLASALAIFTVNTEFGTKQLQNDFLRTQLNIIADTMKNEIARAGFCYDCTSVNPFRAQGKLGNLSSILISDGATETEGSCIRFLYNHDKRAGASNYGKDDAKGYRKGTDANGDNVIEIYENWRGLENWSCDSTHWKDMTFDRLSIESLSFKRSLLQSVGSTNKAQTVEVTITASLKSDSSISDTVNFTVSVPNVDG